MRDSSQGLAEEAAGTDGNSEANTNALQKTLEGSKLTGYSLSRDPKNMKFGCKDGRITVIVFAAAPVVIAAATDMHFDMMILSRPQFSLFVDDCASLRETFTVSSFWHMKTAAGVE